MLEHGAGVRRGIVRTGVMAIYRLNGLDTRTDRNAFYRQVGTIFEHLAELNVEVTACRLVGRRFEMTTDVDIRADQIDHLQLTAF